MLFYRGVAFVNVAIKRGFTVQSNRYTTNTNWKGQREFYEEMAWIYNVTYTLFILLE